MTGKKLRMERGTRQVNANSGFLNHIVSSCTKAVISRLTVVLSAEHGWNTDSHVMNVKGNTWLTTCFWTIESWLKGNRMPSKGLMLWISPMAQLRQQFNMYIKRLYSQYIIYKSDTSMQIQKLKRSGNGNANKPVFKAQTEFRSSL